MSDIRIESAPEKYQRYLRKADSHEGANGYNGKLDSQDEADAAAAEYCKANPSDCDQFMKYLEGVGYASVRAREITPAETKAYAKLDSMISALGEADAVARVNAVRDLTAFICSDKTPEIKTKAIELLIQASKNESGRKGASAVLASLLESNIPLEFKTKISILLSLKDIDGDWDVRKRAVENLSAIAKSGISTDLREMMLDPLLASLKGDHPGDIATVLTGLIESSISQELRVKMIDAVLQARKDVNEKVRAGAAVVLRSFMGSAIAGDLKAKIQISLLLDAVESNDPNVKYNALNELKTLAKADISTDMKAMMVDTLRKVAFEDADTGMRGLASEALKILRGSKLTNEANAKITFSFILNDMQNERREDIRDLISIFGSDISEELRGQMTDSLVSKLIKSDWVIRGVILRTFKALADSALPSQIKAQIIDHLIGSLSNDDAIFQDGASIALGQFASSNISLALKSRISEPLCDLLENKNAIARLGAAVALGGLAYSNLFPESQTKMISSLIKAMGDANEKVRNAVTNSLSDILVSSGIPSEMRAMTINLLIKALRDKNENVRWSASLTLQGFTTKMSNGDFTELIAKIMDSAIQALGDADINARRGAATALALLAKQNSKSSRISIELKTRMAEPLVKALNDADPIVRGSALSALQELAVEEISPDLKAKMMNPLIRLLSDKDEIFVTAVSNTLLRLADRGISTLKIKCLLILKSLDSKDLVAKSKALDDLKSINLFELDPALYAQIAVKLFAMFGPEDGMAKESISAILFGLVLADKPGQLRARVINFLIKKLEGVNEPEDVRENAIDTLNALTHPEVPFEIRTKLAAHLIKAVADKDPNVRWNAVGALTALAQTNITPEIKSGFVAPMIRALGDQSGNVRLNAASGLGILIQADIPDALRSKMVDPLIRGLEDKDEVVKKGVAHVLSDLLNADISTDLKSRIKIALNII